MLLADQWATRNMTKEKGLFMVYDPAIKVETVADMYDATENTLPGAFSIPQGYAPELGHYLEVVKKIPADKLQLGKLQAAALLDD